MPKTPKPNLPLTHSKRNFARQKLTEVYEKFDEERAKGEEEIRLDALRLLRDKFEQHRVELEQCDEIIQQNTAAADVDEEVKESGQIMDDLKTALFQVVNMIENLTLEERREYENRSEISSQRSVASNSGVTPKLPKLEIGKFNGDPVHWQEFWDQFESLIHSKESMAAVDKFVYLKSYLEGDALRAIDGIALTNAQYPIAVDIIKERFGNKQMVIAAHFEKIMKLSINSRKTSDLRLFFDEIEKHIRSLLALGLKNEQFAETFVPMIMAKLPSDIKLELNRKHGVGAWDLESLRKLLREEVVARERSKEETGAKESKTDEKSVKKEYSNGATASKNHQISTTSALVSSASAKPWTKKCSYCAETTHFSDECKKYPDVDSRKRCLGNRCFVCLRNNKHLSRNCPVQLPCFYCQKTNHHRSLCLKEFGGQKKENSVASATNAIASNNKTVTQTLTVAAFGASKQTVLLAPKQKVVMPTAMTTVLSSDGEKSSICRLVLDTGSSLSFITESVAKKLKLTSVGYQTLELGTFGSNSTNTVQTAVSRLKIKTVSDSIIEIMVNIIPTITVSVRKEKIDIAKYGFIKNLTLAEPLSENIEDHTLDLLIGMDYYNELVGEKRIEIEKGLFLTDTVFGWVLSGRFGPMAQNSGVTSALLTPLMSSENVSVDAKMEKFWKLESIGITDDGQIKDDDVALKKFNDTVKFENGRYQVSWPWKESEPNLPENYEMALGRLKTLQKRLDQQPEVRKKYADIIQHQLDNGIIEKVGPDTPEGPKKHYLPHHVVFKEDSASTKLRVVYDASAKARKNANSLNECLYRGPVLIEDLCGLLLRFRSYPIVLLSDIEKAFLQIGLHVADRDVTRFLWFDADGKLETYRFCRVCFGVISSPFLLEATVAYHLKLDGSEVAEKIGKNIYVDNVCGQAETVEEGRNFYDSAKRIFSAAAMNLREWSSNSDQLMNHIPPDDQLTTPASCKTKILGLAWLREADTLGLRHGELEVDEGALTKRKMLSSIASIYDPLGLHAPVTVRAKLAIQSLWKLKLDWDAPVPEKVEREWETLQTDLQGLPNLMIKRFIGVKNSLQNEAVSVEIHCFCDSSENAYAACVYLRVTQENQTVTNLVFSKTRLAPIKTLTMPRLELVAVLIGTRLIRFVESELQIIPTRKVIWSDSKCVLAWLSSKKLKEVFVENRLKEIRQIENTEFYYVSSEDNPADKPTRGMSADELRDFTPWWEGPKWLKEATEKWPAFGEIMDDEKRKFEELENRKTAPVMTLVVPEPADGLTLLLERCSDFERLLRVTAYVLRAINNKFKKVRLPSENFTMEELASAQRKWDLKMQEKYFAEEKALLAKGKSNGLIRQLNLFIDADGLIRCKGRLENSKLSDSAKNPILLPKSGRYVFLLVEHLHEKLMHSGVRHILSELRHQYWIPSARRCIQMMKNKCLKCRRSEGGPFQPPAPPALPKERVMEAPAFTYVGVDFLGPLFVKTAKKEIVKIWICLYTCAVTRAVHLEVVPSMTTEDFLEGFRRFVSRRGKPAVIVSDNAKSFELANSILLRIWSGVISDPSVQNYVASAGIKWKFIVQLAPWMGGFYERLVGLVKRSLRKTIDGRLITYRQLETIVIEAEAVINSRPLGFVGSTLDTVDALTPAMFLGVDKRTGIPNLDIDFEDPDFTEKIDSADALMKKWKKHQQMLDGFWVRFRNEYLVGLRERIYDNKRRGAVSEVPQLGQAVLIKDDLPRGQWKLGIIEKLAKSADGSIRSAVVRVRGNKTLHRPLGLLYPLECLEIPGESVESAAEATDQSSDSRQGENAARKSTRLAAQKAKTAIKELFRRECRAQREWEE